MKAGKNALDAIPVQMDGTRKRRGLAGKNLGGEKAILACWQGKFQDTMRRRRIVP